MMSQTLWGFWSTNQERSYLGKQKTSNAQGADLVVVVSHMGLDDDQEQASEFADVDIYMGGHHHVAIDPPLVITNEETGKRIPVVHSGAFAKFVGRLDVVVRDGEVLSHKYKLIPVDSYIRFPQNKNRRSSMTS